MSKLKFWQIGNADGHCILTLDVPKSSQNVLSSRVTAELDTALDQIIERNSNGLIIRSSKPDSFISGADIDEFRLIESTHQAEEAVKSANTVINRLAELFIPTVAMIDGHCLGGGLELALACDYRVCSDSPSIRLGLPEVKLGIHPGLGGTVRLPEIIGLPGAMDLILSGRTVTPRAAKKMGILDLCVPHRQLQRSAAYLLKTQPEVKRAAYPLKALAWKPARMLMAEFLEKQVGSKAGRNHYPAPYAVIEYWRRHGGNRQTMFAAEQKSVSRLLTTSTSKNLVKVYFLQEQLKSLGKTKSKSQFNRLHVIGAGVMGGDIASWCALKGMTVTIHDRSTEALARAGQRAYRLFKKKLKQDRMVERTMDRFQQDLSGNGAKTADVIIEAIFENIEAKRDVFREMEKMAKPNAILASNTSGIPLEQIAGALKKPGRIVGLHFFNPVAKMQLVEIVSAQNTFHKVEKSAISFAAQIGRLPVPVKSSPGFLVNRVLMPYVLEAMMLLKEGVPAPIIDKVATNFGMPMGPVTLADTVGLDICYHVGENLSQSYGGEMPALLKEKVDAGNLGKKTGRGFYTWVKGKPEQERDKGDHPEKEIEDRLIYRYLNECVACLNDEIVKQASHIDGALIFGTGFAPFTGGPMNYIQDKGAGPILARLNELHKKYGDRFKPSAGWEKL